MDSLRQRLAILILLIGVIAPALAHAQSPVRYEPVKPKLQIEIPTLKFSDTIVQRTDGTPTEVSIPWIGEYFAAIYRFAVPVGAILATIIIMIGGVIWLTSGGSGRLSTAKEWIGNAVVGLLLLVGSYVVLNLINPDLVRFQALRIRIAAPDLITEESETEVVSGSDPADITRADGGNILGRSLVSASLLPALQAA
ncbi:MAG: pilin, partial [bacterium]|nr:pilin [bacterium]